MGVFILSRRTLGKHDNLHTDDFLDKPHNTFHSVVQSRDVESIESLQARRIISCVLLNPERQTSLVFQFNETENWLHFWTQRSFLQRWGAVRCEVPPNSFCDSFGAFCEHLPVQFFLVLHGKEPSRRQQIGERLMISWEVLRVWGEFDHLSMLTVEPGSCWRCYFIHVKMIYGLGSATRYLAIGSVGSSFSFLIDFHSFFLFLFNYYCRLDFFFFFPSRIRFHFPFLLMQHLFYCKVDKVSRSFGMT